MKIRLMGAGMVLGAGIAIIAAYAGKPDEATCQVINSVSVQLGHQPTCSPDPVAWLAWLALGLAVPGFAAIAYGRRRA